MCYIEYSILVSAYFKNLLKTAKEVNVPQIALKLPPR